MTDFDARLRRRLERLDTAIPVSEWSEAVRTAPLPLGAARPTAGRRSGRKLVVLMAAAALLIGVSTVAAVGVLNDGSDAPPEVDSAVAEVFKDRDCISAAEARPMIRERLDEIGYPDWPIESRSYNSSSQSAEEARCVGAVVIGGTVSLFPAPGTDILEAMELVADELLLDCYSRDEATQLVTTALAAHGAEGWTISGDASGPQSFPSDQEQAYKQHVADGCVVYAGMPFGPGEVFLWGGCWP